MWIDSLEWRWRREDRVSVVAERSRGKTVSANRRSFLNIQRDRRKTAEVDLVLDVMR